MVAAALHLGEGLRGPARPHQSVGLEQPFPTPVGWSARTARHVAYCLVSQPQPDMRMYNSIASAGVVSPTDPWYRSARRIDRRASVADTASGWSSVAGHQRRHWAGLYVNASARTVASLGGVWRPSHPSRSRPISSAVFIVDPPWMLPPKHVDASEYY
ncbi:hypothetical protein GCM10011512_01000 [Tersicoccus solisilvae]|uniref:Uncharacterized protein n=1 Tax=Tersicoccus solisilvae TaxID=1882339 RepID=A0ABQ1NRG3_9MICC|nr:hypothetical protein GCM10011512_01000 [Tersicoccus solisilvae]